ncbi:MAG: hypothetical protein M1833_005347 [Piccolia ochrophora]|nr:MAG: hypothetical protein M1833_005347 [Piccolia ochrophora]
MSNQMASWTYQYEFQPISQVGLRIGVDDEGVPIWVLCPSKSHANNPGESKKLFYRGDQKEPCDEDAIKTWDAPFAPEKFPGANDAGKKLAQLQFIETIAAVHGGVTNPVDLSSGIAKASPLTPNSSTPPAATDIELIRSFACGLLSSSDFRELHKAMRREWSNKPPQQPILRACHLMNDELHDALIDVHDCIHDFGDSACELHGSNYAEPHCEEAEENSESEE